MIKTVKVLDSSGFHVAFQRQTPPRTCASLVICYGAQRENVQVQSLGFRGTLRSSLETPSRSGKSALTSLLTGKGQLFL